jgi:apolipoprotein N-acyltransferase
MLQTLAFPVFSLYPLAFVAIVPLYLAVYRQSRRKAFLWGWVYGFSLGLSSFSWLSEVMSFYGGLGPWGGALVLIILAAYLALYQGVFGMLASRLSPADGAWSYIALTSLFWTGLEWLKNWIFTGFNWTPIAGAFSAEPRLLGAADLIGVYGLNWPVAAVSAALAASLIMWREEAPVWRCARPLAAPLMIVPLMLAYGTFQYSHYEGLLKTAQNRKVAVLQASVDQNYKWDSKYRGFILNRYEMLARQAADQDPFLIVWSETAAPFVFGSDPYETRWILDLADRLKRPMLLGVTAYDWTDGDSQSLRNRAWLIYPDSRLGPFYDKRHLVPFGEYIPLAEELPFLKSAFLQGVLGAAGNFTSGGRTSPISYEGVTFGPLICFESLFPYLARANVLAGADVLSVTTNDAWFGESSAPDQHFAHSILRAVETRRPLVRAANNGISGVILPSGRVEGRSALNDVKAYAWALPVLPAPSTTFFASWGWVLGPVSAVAAAFAFLLQVWRFIHERRGRPGGRPFADDPSPNGGAARSAGSAGFASPSRRFGKGRNARGWKKRRR